MLHIFIPNVTSNVYSLYNKEVEDLGNIELIETDIKQVDLSVNDIQNILGKPNSQLGYSYRWYLENNDDIILIELINLKENNSNTFNKLTISTSNVKNEDLELILKYFVFINKGYDNLLEEKTNSELLDIVDNYFNNGVWREFAYDTDTETSLPYNEVLREFLKEKLLSEVSLHELISDGYIELDY